MKLSKKIISLFLTAVIVPCAVSTVSFQVSADEDKFEISKSSMTIGAGETYKLNTNTEKSVLWGTSNTTVVSPSKGNITGKKSGKATVVAKRSDGKLAKCSVSVKEAPYEIYLNKTNITLGVGETYDLNSSLPNDCAAHSIVYTTDDSTVATVKSAGGLVTAKAEGTAVITATAYNGVSTSCVVTVKKAPTSISLNKTSLTLGIGETYDLNSSLPSGCAAYRVVYTTDNNSVATVKSAGGFVTARAEGTANITAKSYNGKTVTCKITVKKAPTSISLNKTDLTLTEGKTYDLNSSLPSGCAAYSVVYTTDDNSVATVKSAGGLVTAKAEGTAIITAVAYNGVAVNCTVNVVKKSESKPNKQQNEVSTSTSSNYTDDDLFCLAAVIWQEAGANYCSDNMQLMVANVVMNHVKSPNYPDTVREVITRKGAYGTMYWDGVSLPNATDSVTKAAIDRCYKNAKKILDGYRILPDNVIYQAGFVQGSGIYACEGGIYFCYA